MRTYVDLDLAQTEGIKEYLFRHRTGKVVPTLCDIQNYIQGEVDYLLSVNEASAYIDKYRRNPILNFDI